MKSFTPEIYKRDIVMISDYVNPVTYSHIELTDEMKFLKLIPKHIANHGINFTYLEVKTLNELNRALQKLDRTKVVIFNWCEFLEEQEDTGHLVTELLEKLGFIYTGADTANLKLVNSKELTKKRLMANDVLTPAYRVVSSRAELTDIPTTYPVIVKLENRHASVGLNLENVVYDFEALRKIVDKLLSSYNSKLLIEQFISGQEYTVTVWGNGPSTKCIYFSKELYKDCTISNIYTEVGKFSFGSAEEKNLKSASFHNKKFKKTIDLLERLAVQSYRVLNMKDYARFDIREQNDNYYVLDCNANPRIDIGSQVLKGAKRLYRFNYGETVMKICDFALQRKLL